MSESTLSVSEEVAKGVVTKPKRRKHRSPIRFSNVDFVHRGAYPISLLGLAGQRAVLKSGRIVEVDVDQGRVIAEATNYRLLFDCYEVKILEPDGIEVATIALVHIATTEGHRLVSGAVRHDRRMSMQDYLAADEVVHNHSVAAAAALELFGDNSRRQVVNKDENGIFVVAEYRQRGTNQVMPEDLFGAVKRVACGAGVALRDLFVIGANDTYPSGYPMGGFRLKTASIRFFNGRMDSVLGGAQVALCHQYKKFDGLLGPGRPTPDLVEICVGARRGVASWSDEILATPLLIRWWLHRSVASFGLDQIGRPLEQKGKDFANGVLVNDVHRLLGDGIASLQEKPSDQLRALVGAAVYCALQQGDLPVQPRIEDGIARAGINLKALRHVIASKPMKQSTNAKIFKE